MRVNGLGLTLHAIVNPIMKFIYILCKCKCKNKYIYIILHGPIKQGTHTHTHTHTHIYNFAWLCKAIYNNVKYVIFN